jgi:hypothetical protein
MDAAQRRHRRSKRKQAKGKGDYTNTSPPTSANRHNYIRLTGMNAQYNEQRTPEMGRIDRPRTNRNEHEKKTTQTKPPRTARPNIAMPWKIWERKENEDIRRTGVYAYRRRGGRSRTRQRSNLDRRRRYTVEK